MAGKSIKKDELIFTERAHSFLPISKRLVCQNCAATQLIPFPCYNCNGRVVYCSLKCRDAHRATHGYECLGYQKDLFGNPLHHLALRMVLDEIPEIISFLSQKKTAKAIWNELTSEKSSLMQSNLQYTQTLSLITHMEKKSWQDILAFANAAIIFTSYLRNQTNFFDLLKNTKASLDDWLLVIASLILRHMGQLDVNGNTLAVLAIKIADPFDSTLLLNKLWQSPFHVRRGLLHMFSKYEDVICANFPYYSLCNHACYPSIVTKWHGRILSAYAVNDIEAGSEILNSYLDDYLNLRRMERQSYLAHKFHFECKCEKCTKENPDQDWEKYHRFRCENCRQNFIAEEITSCTKCGAMQHKLMEKLGFLNEQLNTPSQKMRTAEPLLNAIKAYEDLDQWLLGPHDIKLHLSIKVVEKCFEMADIAFSTQFKQNLKRIIEILKFHLQYKIERYLLKNIEYIGPMTYLWDFIALGIYQCTAAEMQEMLQAIEVLEDETKKLFINYYNDYIVGNIK